MNILAPKFTIRPGPGEQPFCSALRAAVHGCNGTPSSMERLLDRLDRATSLRK